MNPNPYLQHLISDPNFGYLFPHRLALAAFGVANDYQLRKHYPRLVDGQHYIKIRGADHVERLFYTLVGLLALSDLVNTPQAQAFKQALIAHTQPGGAIIQAQPASLYQSPLQTPAHLYAQPPARGVQSESSPINEQSIDPNYLVAYSLQSQSEQEFERSVPPKVPATSPTPPPVHYQTPQETAALIFEAQRVATEQAQQTAQTLLNAQRLITEQQPTQIHVSVNFWKRWLRREAFDERQAFDNRSRVIPQSHWLLQQDPWAISLIAACIVALAGMGAYFWVGAAVHQVQSPRYSTPIPGEKP